MPSGRIVLPLVLGVGAEELLALKRGDGADGVISVAKFTRAVQNGVDVEGGG